MKMISILTSFIIFSAYVQGKEQLFTGCTPAGSVVRNFLGIPLTDSIDFIRWNFSLDDNKYTIECNYGIGKPNTNGFWNGGKIVKLQGTFKLDKNYLQFLNNGKKLNFVELNTSLVHITDENRNLLVGTGGFSYTLNNVAPTISDQLSLSPTPIILKDSMQFHGRTPCRGIDSRHECIKLKWSMVLFANSRTNQPTTFRMRGSIFEKFGPVTGSWKISKGKDGRIIYQLDLADHSKSFYLLKLDDNNVIFTDEKGNLLVGDSDFSYSLSKF